MTKMFFGLRFFGSVVGALRSDTNARDAPSGDQRGELSCPGPYVKRVPCPWPSNGAIQIADRYPSFSRSISRTTYATRPPSGEICASVTKRKA